ncbi:MAG TPA: hypothetical protein VGR89_01725, partial [Puia sp.]|nr:hypothetical protein [Puia sp.]
MGERPVIQWWNYKETVTVADVLESGACLGGVIKWLKRHQGVIAVKTANYRRNPYVLRASHGSGDGFDYGWAFSWAYGSGDRSGDGFGFGWAFSWAYGFGDESGNGFDCDCGD